jgi:tetratricopeptide (TPR) repeat protein
MSRFINLEIGGEAEDQSSGVAPGAAKDEHFYLRKAQAAFERADFEKALRQYGKALEFAPQHATAWTAQVRMLVELGQVTDANAWADKAVDVFPSLRPKVRRERHGLQTSSQCRRLRDPPPRANGRRRKQCVPRPLPCE